MTIGRERYHEVAMGQGQAEVAVGLLRDCARYEGIYIDSWRL